MPVPLNKIPGGLLDFLGIKSGEWGPRELGQVLQPVIELGAWYQNLYAQEFAITFAAAGVFAATTNAASVNITATVPPDADIVVANNIQVPQTEAWLILEACVGLQYSAAGGQSGDAWWQFRGVAMPSSAQGFTTSDAAVVRTGNRTLLRPFWARPGDTLSVVHGGLLIPAGTITVFGTRLRIARFRI